MSIQEEVIDLISSVIDVPPSKIKLTDTFSALGIDELDSVEIEFLIEDNLNYNYSGTDYITKRFKTVGDLIKAVEDQKK